MSLPSSVFGLPSPHDSSTSLPKANRHLPHIQPIRRHTHLHTIAALETKNIRYRNTVSTRLLHLNGLGDLAGIPQVSFKALTGIENNGAEAVGDVAVEGEVDGGGVFGDGLYLTLDDYYSILRNKY
jgi:hypothetical protein